MIVLGLHGGVTIGQHEPAAALIIDGKVVALCEEERYLRIKSCYGYLPNYSIRACLKIANIKWEDIDLIVTPGITYDDFSDRIEQYLTHQFGSCPKIERVHHQIAHISAAFYGSGLEESLVLSIDATGDGASCMAGYAKRGKGIEIFNEIPTQQSLGFFYTLMTYYLGFEDGDEYKVMGLAPYGKPSIDLSKIIRPVKGGWEFDWSFIRDNPPPRSPFEPNYSKKLAEILKQPHRVPSAPMTQYYKDIARSTQAIFEDCLLSLIEGMQARVPNCRNLCYAGGVALNCSANKKLLYSDSLDHVYVSPVSSDRGLALGCAYHGAVISGDKPWQLSSAYLGSSYSNDHIRNELIANGINFREVEDPCAEGAEILSQDKILGWYQGRSEAGARALGNRSILAKCQSTAMRDKVNMKIKYREEFRPFAPAILFEDSKEYFKTEGQDLPWMCFTADANQACSTIWPLSGMSMAPPECKPFVVPIMKYSTT
jgi:carbamoyltransferase